LQINGGGVTESGPDAKPDRVPVTRRYPYQEAQSAEFSYSGRGVFKKFWESSLAYTTSQKNKFDMIRWRGQVSMAQDWTVFSEALLVRTEPETVENPSEIAQFDNHDRVLVGVSYVF
jgi:hypothetical protein